MCASARAGAAVPALSVTVLNYNYARYLPACLDSILSQTFADFEVILIDDCSTDGSLDVIQPYLADPRVVLVTHTKNQGYLASLVEGSEASASRYLMVISADDMARSPHAFARQIAALDRAPTAAFCFSHYDRLLGDEAKLVGRHETFDRDVLIPGAQAFQRVLSDPSMPVLHTGTMLRRDAYDAVGGYSRDVRYAIDLAMWLALSLRGEVAYVGDALYGYRTHDAQMSRSLEGYERSTREALALVDAACLDAARLGLSGRQLRRQAIQAYMLSWAMHEAFMGARLVPLRRCWQALKLRPWNSLASCQLWIILVRVVLGQRGFATTRSLARALVPIRRHAPFSRV